MSSLSLLKPFQIVALLSWLLVGSTVLGSAADWPMWRYDAGHTANSPEQLPERLHLQWVLTFSERERVWDDPLNHDLMTYDRVFEPIVWKNLLLVGFSDRDKLTAYDIDTGTEEWTFFADGPIWFAPVAWNDRIYVCSDDGYLYCLEAETGGLLWKFRGAPGDRKVLGNRRVVSAWPARGGPVIRDGKLYFATSIWPFMGTFIYALDAETGRVEWVNDGTGAHYIKQPHSAPSFAGVAPQGILVALENLLLVPGGRSVPAAFDRATGDLVHFHLNDGGKGNGGSFVIGTDDEYYLHTRLRGVRAYETKSGKKEDFVINEPVLDGEFIYTAALQPDLKTRLERAERKWKEADEAHEKANKQFDEALAVKRDPLTKEIQARDEAKARADDAKRLQEERKDESKEAREAAEQELAAAEKALEEARKKYDEAKKKKEAPIDDKLEPKIAETLRELCYKAYEYDELRAEWSRIGRDVRTVQAYDAKKELRWEFEADGTGDLIKAGNRLYAAGPEEIVGVEHPNESTARVGWRHPVDGDVQRLLAASGKLFAVTLDGRILCFGEEATEHPLRSPTPHVANHEWPFSSPADNRLARRLVGMTDADAGYALSIGVDDGRMLEALSEESDLHLVAIERDGSVVEGLRRKFDYMSLYGKRLALHQGDAQSFQPPPYIANLVVIGEAESHRLNDPSTIRLIYESVRPYGGALWFAENPDLARRIESLGLPNAEVIAGPAGSTIVLRQGPLPGAADWTHQYGNLANTVKSDDQLVKLPLGLLWFGGNSNTEVLPRHGHGPSEQVVGGRMFIEGMNCLSARDVYTGRVLWKREFDNLGTYGIYYDHTYKDDPLNTAYNQVHIPGANGRGTNYVATEEAVYLAIGSACHVLDAATGQDLDIISLPRDPASPQAAAWGFIGVHGDLLLAGNDFAHHTRRFDLDKKAGDEDSGSKTAPRSADDQHEDPEDLAAEEAAKREAQASDDDGRGAGGRRGRKRKEKAEVPSIEDLSASQGLIAFNRHTGGIAWKVDAQFSFLHNGIVAGNGRFYLLDKFTKSAEDKLKRRGLTKPEDYRILAIDAFSGDTVWEKREGIFGTWLSFSSKHDILLQAGAKGRDRLADEVGEGMTAYRGRSGEVIWEKNNLAYAGPAILHNDLVITTPDQYADSSGAFHLVDGSPYLIRNPLTGKLEPWRITRAYGCNTPIAGEHLLTFRSGAAGFYDLDNLSGTGNFGGFKSGCTANLIPANGILNAPDYTRTCSCGYQNQTSLGLVHMPDVELWTYNRFGADAVSDEKIERVGINFGAPGDRRATDGTLWLEYPEVGGDSPTVSVEVEGNDVDFFRRHSSRVETTSGLGWVAASGIRRASSITITPKMQYEADGSDKLEIRLRGRSNDAEESAEGRVDLHSSDLELVEEEGRQLVGLRFEDVQLLPQETVRSAYIQFTVDEPTAGAENGHGQNEADLLIAIVNTHDADPFTDKSGDLSSRERWETPVEWKPEPWKKKGDAGGEQRTPNLAPLLNAIVRRDDWKYGNAVAFVFTGHGKRVAMASDQDAKQSPKLVIETDGRMPRVRVAAKEDDAEEGPDGEVTLDSSDLELVTDIEKQHKQVVGLRFRHLQIPRGSSLRAAYIQFVTDEATEAETELEVRVEDTADAAPYKSEKNNITSRKASDPYVKWSPSPWRREGAARHPQRTPDLSALIRPIVSRDTWKPGNSLAFVITGDGSRTAVSFDGKKEHAPKLILHYDEEIPPLPPEEIPRYTIRLHFFDPDRLPIGRRVFDIRLQGQPALAAFDMASMTTADGREQVVVQEFRGIPIEKGLTIDFDETSQDGEPPVLSGVEIIAEPPSADQRPPFPSRTAGS